MKNIDEPSIWIFKVFLRGGKCDDFLSLTLLKFATEVVQLNISIYIKLISVYLLLKHQSVDVLPGLHLFPNCLLTHSLISSAYKMLEINFI